MDGEYPEFRGDNPAIAKYWFDFMADSRHWELEPYFNLDGGRALALEDTEYLVYIEKPGPLEMSVEKHGYDVFWTDPATGETVRKKFSGDHFTGTPPDPSHDWLLHVVREGALQSMNRSYKFESREIVLQELCAARGRNRDFDAQFERFAAASASAPAEAHARRFTQLFVTLMQGSLLLGAAADSGRARAGQDRAAAGRRAGIALDLRRAAGADLSRIRQV